MPEKIVKKEGEAEHMPDLPSNDRWPVDLDAALVRSGGKYSKLEMIARDTGRTMQSLMSRWHRLRVL